MNSISVECGSKKAIAISVVIPTCGRPDLLSRCLDCLVPGTQTLAPCQYEVIVTDDGSATVQSLLTEKYPWVRWIAGPRKGPAANRNNGARLARHEWIAFTDDDCVPSPQWLAAYVAGIHDGCRAYEGKTTCDAGINSPLEHSPVNTTGGCFWSCNIMMQKALFEALGGFDEGYPYPYMEDADLRDRLINAGNTFDFVPSAVVDHPPRPSASGWRLARYHESWMYHWYKSGRRKLGSPRLFVIIVLARVGAIGNYRVSADTLRAIGSLVVELSGILARAPFWEWKYRWRFRVTSVS